LSYQVFARKYRPRSFADVLGQDHVIQTLRNAIEQNRLAHAYLFVGPRGTGKTSTARIFAKALNSPGGPAIEFDPDHPDLIEIAEGRSLDVLEIDGASNNGVEQVRQLRETVQYAPAKSPFKIYYIDEVHMLSPQAFNALLKTLEEPPPHVKFIFATTDPQKILATVISRCQRFDLRPIPTDIIAKQLLNIAEIEGIKLDPTAAYTVAKGADGGMRDAQSMLDQLVAFCGEEIKEEHVLEIFGFTSHETVHKLTKFILTKDTAAALELIHQQESSGKNLHQLLAEMIGSLRGLLVAKLDDSKTDESHDVEGLQTLLDLCQKIKLERLLNIIDVFAEADGRMKWATHKRLHLEMAIIRAIHSLDEVLIDDVIRSLDRAPDDLSISPASSTAEEKKNSPLAEEAAPQISKEPVSAPAAPTQDPPWNTEPPSEQHHPPEPQHQADPGRPQAEESSSPPIAPPIDSSDPISSLMAMAVKERPEEPKPEPPVNSPPPPSSSSTPEKTPSPVDESDFYEDPLIQKALEIFNAKIVS